MRLNQYKWSVVGLFVLAVGVTASGQLKGLGFNAPTVNSRSDVFGPQTGEIVFDGTDDSFYGKAVAGWIPLGGASQTVPAGTISAFAGAAAPTGYLIADGSAVSRTTYADLFSVVGTSFGDGDGSTTFNLPDLRGRFLRGVTGASGNDPDASARVAMATGGNSGNSIGSVQGHAFQTHTHTQNSHSHSVTDPGHSHSLYIGSTGSGQASLGATSIAQTFRSPALAITALATNTTGVSVNSDTATNQNATATGGTSQATSNETRPVNAYVNFIIKY